MYAVFVGGIAFAYLFGSVPFGLLIARSRGKDLRAIGSGNIGATNVARALGRKWGYICFGLDVLKGLAPAVGVRLLAAAVSPVTGATIGPVFLALWLAVGIAAIMGHIFPVYLKFKGGKGVSTSFGVALGIWPYFTLCAAVALVVWVVVVLLWRYVSLASICASVAFPVVLALGIALNPAWQAARLWPLLVAALVIPILVIIRHRENIRRLAAGTESKIRRKEGTS
jgi:glycerol-3-phosphate acyltransferase PlsY